MIDDMNVHCGLLAFLAHAVINTLFLQHSVIADDNTITGKNSNRSM